MNYIDLRNERMAEEPEFAEAIAMLNQRIEDEARARLQALDDARALRRAGIRSADEVPDDDYDDFDEDDEDGPEIFYVR